ncbi:hypothetical protein [Peredibacter starrii]|uniref:Uncharacterized protein n=1 Tax=Peredibacter starrii TaxID=28202 RepID=A0AAX4HNN1_9BACT|nr:hypothetical protein [Peredibacter starrii]WPU64787.1 hypothetical protein SOO65_19010 [Peredibacter starrii]
MKFFITFLLFISQAQAMEIYLLDTKINNTVFKDLMIVNSIKTPKLEGTVTVPGQFTTKMLTVKHDRKLITFDISTIENGSPLKASYQLRSVNDFQNLDGELTIENQRYSIVGKRIYAE